MFIDGSPVGLLTDSDGFDPGGHRQKHGLLDGAQTMRVDALFDGDGWGMYYSELTLITTERVAAVSEPATLLMLGLGLAGLGFASRRRSAL